MKKKVFMLSAISAIFVLGLGLVAIKSNSQSANSVSAEVHLANYDPYTYSGTYYNGIDVNTLTEGLNGTLRTSLTSLIYPEGWYTYGKTGETHLSTQLQYADEDPTNSSNMVYLYTRASVRKNAASTWNREHVWCQSLSNNCWGEGKAGTDVLHIRPTYNTTNSTRSNYPYGDTNKSNPKYFDPDTGKTTTNPNKLHFGYLSGGYFEPLDSVKGDVARIVMYVWTCYKNSKYEKASQLPYITNVFKDYDTLLKWHTEDRPDVMEGNRNDYAEKRSIQENRNPFVDHPEYAWMIFGDSASANVKQTCMDAYPADGGAPKTMTGISISGTPNKTEYFAGETFDPTGLTVTGTYDDGSTKDIPLSNCTWTPNPLVENATTVVCKYNIFTAIYTGITVSKSNIHVHTFSDEYTNDATYHWHAATCEHTNEVSGKEKHSFINEVIRPTEETTGYTTHICRVCGYTYTDSETPVLNLVRIQAQDNKIDTGYQIGEDLDLEVTAVYDDYSTATVSDYIVEGFNNRKSGEQIIMVTYHEKAAILTVKVLPGEGEEEEPGQPEQPDQPDQPEEKTKRGCSGSITASLSIAGLSALIGLIFIFKRKR